ncbi:MAG: PKD domain-containing protein [Planctomycetes bacterium]|nr:PKD domain-containing protein [Planctomycetota bacterium]
MSSAPVITTHPASSSVCTGNSLTLSVVAQGSDLVYQWRKDGTPIAGSNTASFTIPVVAPIDAGRYACRVANACGALTSNEAVITVLAAPTAAFGASTVSGCPPLTVDFFDQSSGSIREWRWDFDADGTIDSTAQNPTWVYQQSGTYSVRLTVIGTSGCPSTLLRSGYIRALATATPDFSATPTTGAIPLTVAFQDMTTGSPATWAWDLDNDGITDSTTRNPSFTYVEAGVYDVRLTVTSAITGCPSSTVMPFFITAVGPTSNTLSPQILQYQFNEVRGTAVANTASETHVRPFGTVTVAGWQADPGRAGFRGNEPGAGCLGRMAQPPAPSVVTGWSPRIAGSYTVMWWQRLYAPAGGGDQHYLWQSTGWNRPFECFLESDGLLTCQYREGRGGRQQSLVTSETRVDQRLGTWMHIALVVDRAAGIAQFFFDGLPENRSRSFTADPGELTPGDDLVLGGPHPTNGSAHAEVFTLLGDLDDFRVYAEARTGAQILSDMRAEVATGGLYAEGCAGSAGIPRIAANGPPVLPSPSLEIALRRAQPGVPAALLIGFTARTWDSITLPLDLGPIGFAGCSLETAAHLVFAASTGGGDITLPLALPNDPSLAGAHVYAQWLVFGTPGATSAGFDLNLQR